MVFAGLYPVEGHEYAELRDALEKLRLNDAAFTFEPETSAALGFGFRCGFLGLLHMEIVQERLEREFDLDLITTAPGVLYRVTTTDGEVQDIDNPAKLPDAGRIEQIEEPIITAMILTPAEYVGAILAALRGQARHPEERSSIMASDRVLITYELPLNEIVLDFYDRLKTSPAATRRSTTTSPATGRRRWSSSTSWSTASRSTRCRSSSTATRPTSAAARWPRRCAS